MSTTCKALIYETGWVTGRRCIHPTKGGGDFCAIHSPEAQAKRAAKRAERDKERSARWKAEWDRKEEARRKASEYDSVASERDRYQDALKQIMEGTYDAWARLTARNAITPEEK